MSRNMHVKYKRIVLFHNTIVNIVQPVARIVQL